MHLRHPVVCGSQNFNDLSTDHLQFGVFAVCCRVLQCDAVCCSVMRLEFQMTRALINFSCGVFAVCCPCVAVFYRVLQCGALRVSNNLRAVHVHTHTNTSTSTHTHSSANTNNKRVSINIHTHVDRCTHTRMLTR